MPTHKTICYGLGPFETRLGGFTSFLGSQTEEICYGYYLPFMEGGDVWGGPYIFGCVEIRGAGTGAACAAALSLPGLNAGEVLTFLGVSR